MDEAVLWDFFQETASVGDLKLNMVGARERLDDKVTRIHIQDMTGVHHIRSQHLIRLCDAVLEGSLTCEDLNSIGFLLVASDHFTFWKDERSETDLEGATVVEVANHWAVPEINAPITLPNVAVWRDMLVQCNCDPSRLDYTAPVGKVDKP